MSKYTYTFDQLRDIDDNIYRCFANYARTIRDYGSVDQNRYFTADFGVISAFDEKEACEILFKRYNTFPYPSGYYGRRMHVSDIITLWNEETDPPEKSAWFCDSVGFVKLDGGGDYE